MQERLLSKEHEDRISTRDQTHRMFSWSVQSAVKPMVIAKADGCYLWDAEGTRYFDLWSQACYLQIGYNHPRVIEAIKKQAENLCVLGPELSNESTSGLAQMLCELAPGDLNKVFFTLGGAEATENAIRMARLFKGKSKILTRHRSYHGATLGALSASGDPRRFYVEPEAPGFVHIPDCYCYRCPFHKTYPGCNIVCARHIDEVIQLEGNVAAVLVESIVGSNGLLIPPPEYLPIVRQVCDQHGVLLILDEVMAGIGRSGRWFACEHYNVVPDMMTLAKGITSGYVPIGAVLLSSKIAQFFQDRYLPCGLTFSSHPLACAAGIAALTVMREEGLVERSEKLGEFLRAELERFKEKHPSVGDVRNKGLWGCIELVADRASRKPLVRWNASGAENKPMNEVAKSLKSQGMLPRVRWNYIFIGPPLIATEEDLRGVTKALDRALETADGYVE